jgi:hypothetical protein
VPRPSPLPPATHRGLGRLPRGAGPLRCRCHGPHLPVASTPCIAIRRASSRSGRPAAARITSRASFLLPLPSPASESVSAGAPEAGSAAASTGSSGTANQYRLLVRSHRQAALISRDQAEACRAYWGRPDSTESDVRYMCHRPPPTPRPADNARPSVSDRARAAARTGDTGIALATTPSPRRFVSESDPVTKSRGSGRRLPRPAPAARMAGEAHTFGSVKAALMIINSASASITAAVKSTASHSVQGALRRGIRTASDGETRLHVDRLHQDRGCDGDSLTIAGSKSPAPRVRSRAPGPCPAAIA